MEEIQNLLLKEKQKAKLLKVGLREELEQRTHYEQECAKLTERNSCLESEL